MLIPLFPTLLTIFILICLIAWLDARLQTFWGAKGSVPKAILLLFTLLSTLYQIAFLTHFPILLSMIDGAGILICIFFFRTILSQFKIYANQIFVQPFKTDDKALYLLYPFLGYLLFLSIFSVPGWNWDSMIHNLVRPFLFLNEGTIFPSHYSDARQILWPMGGDLLTYLFSRWQATFGIGFLAFIFYIAILISIFDVSAQQGDRKTAVTLTFVAASIPLMVYSATSDKTDLYITFAFLMIWKAFLDFSRSKDKRDLFLIVLALGFGLSCKLPFLVLGPLSIAAFLLLKPGITQDFRISPKIGVPLLLWFLFASQIHVYLYNLIAYGFGPNDAYLWEGPSAPSTWLSPIQNFAKQQLMFFDFVLPLSFMGIPFVDTWLSAFYNHTIGFLTGDALWNYHYFPQEMSAACGPFGLFVLWGIYKTCFKKSQGFPKALGIVSAIWMLYLAYRIVWQPVSVVRYLLPTVVASLVFLPEVRRLRVFQHHFWVRLSCLGLMAFGCVVNYAKPLIAYHPKAIPWYRYAFADRHYLYHGKYFLDHRMDIYKRFAAKQNRIFVFIGDWSAWVFPYYEYAPHSFVRICNRQLAVCSQEDFHQYDLIVCNGSECIQEWDQKKDFEKIWQNSAPRNGEPNFIVKKAAFYRPKNFRAK